MERIIRTVRKIAGAEMANAIHLLERTKIIASPIVLPAEIKLVIPRLGKIEQTVPWTVSTFVEIILAISMQVKPAPTVPTASRAAR